jgi:hypothetical protein
MSSTSSASPFKSDGSPLERYQPQRYPPFVPIRDLTRRTLPETPNVGLFTVPAPGEKVVKSYRIRVRRPKFRWLVWLAMLAAAAFFIGPTAAQIPWPVTVLLVLAAWGLVTLLLVVLWQLRLRGHTLLYLTSQRVIVVDLGRNLFRRYQSVMSYELESVAGFTLHAQRGLKKLLHLILLKEKRTFYLKFVTPHYTSYEVGAINTRHSEFDPGMDAVALVAELDALVLNLKKGKLPAQ